MSPKINIFNALRNLFGRGSLYDKSRFHPAREWLLGLFLCSLMLIAGGMYAAHTFLKYQNVSTAGGEYVEPVTQYNHALVQKALTLYTNRESAFTALKGEVIIVPFKQEISSTTASSTVQVEVENEIEVESESESDSATTTIGTEVQVGM